MTERLQAGLSESNIRRKLERAEARGAIEPIIRLFSWKNGVNNDCQALSQVRS